MWAVLGEIEFEVIDCAREWEQRFSAGFAEHARIAGKPLLEAVGGELDEITWEIALHAKVHDVDARLRAIREALAAQQPLALVLGDGTYLGPWILTEGSLTTQKTTASGQLVSAGLQITLREFTGDFTAPPPRPAVADAAPGGSPSAHAPVQPGLMTGTVQPPTPVQALVQAARQVESGIRSAIDAVQQARQLPPLAALARIPAIVAALDATARAVETVQQAGARVAEAAVMIPLGEQLASSVKTMHAHLRQARDGDGLHHLREAYKAGSHARSQMEQARDTLLVMTADTALRRR